MLMSEVLVLRLIRFHKSPVLCQLGVDIEPLTDGARRAGATRCDSKSDNIRCSIAHEIDGHTRTKITPELVRKMLAGKPGGAWWGGSDRGDRAHGTKVTAAQVRRMYEDGLSSAEIAERLGVHRGTVNRKLRRIRGPVLRARPEH